jgi:hypothetical protein
MLSYIVDAIKHSIQGIGEFMNERAIIEKLDRIEKKLDGKVPNRFLDISAVSNLISCSPSTIRRAVAKGELKCSKKVGKLLFHEDAVRKWLNG